MGSERRVVGCMTGTSLDALDVALVRVTGSRLGMIAEFVEGSSRGLGELAQPLRLLSKNEPMSAGRIVEASRAFAARHAHDIEALLRGRRADLIVVHGQTVYHAPPNSWQLFNAAPLVEALRTPVVYDLRAADLAAGGQGAPITPMADWITLRSEREARAVVNLGGFCNVTILPRAGGPEDVEGLDVCACNHVLDGVARVALGKPYDEGGASALAGRADERWGARLGELLQAQTGARRSLGTGDEMGEWIKGLTDALAPSDACASACTAVGGAIGANLRQRNVERVLVAGGGARNAALMGALGRAVGVLVEPTDEHGVPGAYREAMAMAVLGALCQDGVPITLPRVTGVRSPAPVAGVWAGLEHGRPVKA